MQLKYLLAASAASVSLACGIAAPVHAQETTSAVSGQVTSDTGAPVAGAKVTVVHVPSGTTATATTGAGGNFGLRGLRVGGPYTITVDAPGFAPQTVEGVVLTLGDTVGVPIQLSQREIVVQASNSGSRVLTEGSQSAFKSSDIADIVSARRDVRDIIRRDLLASYNANVGGVSIAGGNIRTQRFSVDGVQMQDSFGLNYGGLPSTRGIVSIEMIDQLTVKAAPFDVSEGNFQGGAVNVVLKSGSNQFHATGFGNFGTPGMTGKKTEDAHGLVGDVYPVANTTILNFRNWGGSLSGPIIKDKLFFSAAYEKLTEGTPNLYGITGSAATNIVPLDPSTLNSVINTFNSGGYDKYTIGTVPTAITERDEKYAGKLDWNVTEGQRFSVSYIHHQNVLASFGSGSASGSTSATTPYIALQSDLYQLTEFTNAVSGQLNSQWTDNLSSEVRVAYKYYRRGQDPYFGPDFAQMNVCTDGTSTALSTTIVTNETRCGNGVPIVRLGPDTPRQANQFNNRVLNITANLQLKAGAHTFKLEFDHMHSSLYNLFVFGGSNPGLAGSGGPQGFYYFDSLQDFQNHQANELVFTSTTTGNKADGFVDWAYDVNTVALQDTWRPSPHLTINAGARFDMYDADKSIALNQNFVNRYSALYPGLTNNATLNGRIKLQPRVGFNWSPERSLKISGGAGLFAGGLSDVFVSNNYSNSGTAINSTGAAITTVDIVRLANGSCVDRTVSATTPLAPALCAAALNGVTGGSVPSLVKSYQQNNLAVLGSAPVNFLDPKFKLPAQWKANLSGSWTPHFADSGIASGWTLRADVLYSKAQSAVRWTDLRAQPLYAVVNGVSVLQLTPDGRQRYGNPIPTLTTIGSNVDMELTNTNKGRAWVFAVGANKDFGPVDLSLSYTHQNVKDVAGVLVSSTVGSTYAVPTYDPNYGGAYGRSAFEVTHTIRGTLNFKHKFFGDNETRFGINWELRSGQPYSLTFNDSSTGANGRPSVFGTVNNTSTLFYVPNFNAAPSTVTLSGAGGVTYSATQYGNVVFGASSPPSGVTWTSAQYAASAAANLANVQALVNATALKKYQGQVMPKNLLTGPWYNKVDLNFAQQVPFFFHSKITALFSIENFLNLLNRNWGTYQDIGTTSVVNVSCTGGTANGQTCPSYLYSTYSAPKTTPLPKPSLYAIRAGVRFDF